eukprot:SAG31_NODE_609_length_13567_cov_18.101574_13_plen_737_part_00
MDVDIATIAPGTSARAEFEDDFRADVADALSVGIDRVTVLFVSSGSVVVEFAVAPSSNGVSVATAAVASAMPAGQTVRSGTITAAPSNILVVEDAEAAEECEFGKTLLTGEFVPGGPYSSKLIIGLCCSRDDPTESDTFATFELAKQRCIEFSDLCGGITQNFGPDMNPDTSDDYFTTRANWFSATDDGDIYRSEPSDTGEADLSGRRYLGLSLLSQSMPVRVYQTIQDSESRILWLYTCDLVDAVGDVIGDVIGGQCIGGAWFNAIDSSTQVATSNKLQAVADGSQQTWIANCMPAVLLDRDGRTPKDLDGDGVPNDIDLDDDNDGFSDLDEEACGSNPLNALSTPPDADGDGLCDDVDPDEDGDGIVNADEVYEGPMKMQTFMRMLAMLVVIFMGLLFCIWATGDDPVNIVTRQLEKEGIISYHTSLELNKYVDFGSEPEDKGPVVAPTRETNPLSGSAEDGKEVPSKKGKGPVVAPTRETNPLSGGAEDGKEVPSKTSEHLPSTVEQYAETLQKDGLHSESAEVYAVAGDLHAQEGNHEKARIARTKSEKHANLAAAKAASQSPAESSPAATRQKPAVPTTAPPTPGPPRPGQATPGQKPAVPTTAPPTPGSSRPGQATPGQKPSVPTTAPPTPGSSRPGQATPASTGQRPSVPTRGPPVPGPPRPAQATPASTGQRPSVPTRGPPVPGSPSPAQATGKKPSIPTRGPPTPGSSSMGKKPSVPSRPPPGSSGP